MIEKNAKKTRTLVVEALSALQGGGQTYLLNLFQNVPGKWGGRYRIIAILPDGFARKLPPGLPIKILTPELPAQGLLRRVLWQEIQLPKLMKKLGADILYCPGGSLPIRKIKGVKTSVAFQNMQPFDTVERKRHSFGYQRFRLWLLRFVQGMSFLHADLVIFISKYAKDVMDRSIPQRRGRSVIISHGVSEQFRPSSASRYPNPLDGVEYVLYVSTLTVYKAQIETVLAWAKLLNFRSTHEKLVFVGPEHKPYARKLRALIKSLKLEDKIGLLGEVPHEELPAYYQNAKINLFASSCENCPNILLEAMSAGKPVLCSNYQPMPELAGDAVEYFNPYDPDELSDLLMRYLDDDLLRERMGAAAMKQSERYQWKEAAHSTWKALAELID